LRTLNPPFEPLGARRDRVPEVRARLRVRVRERPDLPARQGPDVAVDQLAGRAEHDRVDRPDVHDVAHGGRRAPVARDRLARHRVGDVVLAEAAVLLGHRQRQEPVLAEQLEVAAREEQLVVRALRVRTHLLLAELDQRRAELPLAVGQEPVGVPLVAEAPVRLATPHLLGHAYLRCCVAGAVIVERCRTHGQVGPHRLSCVAATARGEGAYDPPRATSRGQSTKERRCAQRSCPSRMASRPIRRV
jgi:hypothetical protein